MTKFKREFKFDNNIIETIAYNVIKYRKLSGITQEQLAIGFWESTLQDYSPRNLEETKRFYRLDAFKRRLWQCLFSVKKKSMRFLRKNIGN